MRALEETKLIYLGCGALCKGLRMESHSGYRERTDAWNAIWNESNLLQTKLSLVYFIGMYEIPKLINFESGIFVLGRAPFLSHLHSFFSQSLSIMHEWAPREYWTRRRWTDLECTWHCPWTFTPFSLLPFTRYPSGEHAAYQIHIDSIILINLVPRLL